MNIAALGQENVIQAANDLLISYKKGNGQSCFTHMQTLMRNLLPFFPHVATAVAVYALVKTMVEEWQETGAVSQESLMQLWEECHDSYVGEA